MTQIALAPGIGELYALRKDLNLSRKRYWPARSLVEIVGIGKIYGVAIRRVGQRHSVLTSSWKLRALSPLEALASLAADEASIDE